MGLSILDLVIRRLREENFAADIAYPGQKFPQITEPVAAVHIEKVDRSSMTVTVEVSMLCPASIGGTTCELEALRATEALRWAGAVCVQNGCSYDGVAQVYVVPILATFTGVTEAEECTIWPGFYVYIDGLLQLHAVAFSEEETWPLRQEYVLGEAAPAGILREQKQWQITLEEQIPYGSPEAAESQDGFTLRVVSEGKAEEYTGCRWTSTQRALTKEGLRRIRKGIALGRTEETNG